MALKAPTVPQVLQDKGYTVADETLKVKVSGGKANHDIEIGDSKEPGQYIPQSKHLYFDNEGNVSFRPRLFNPSVGSVVVEDGVIKYITDEWEHHMYENEGEVFGFEHDFVLKQKPSDLTQDYQVVYTIRTKGLKFYKQLPLTQDEIDEGCIRPENVVNSYAIYIDGKRGNHMYEGGKAYATGKVGHLYRVKAIDANGEWTWCDQEFDEKKNEYIQTVPKEFLEAAVYPVRVDPQLGYTSVGASQTSSLSGYAIGSDHDTTVTSYASSITAYGTEASTGQFKGIITDSSLNILTDAIGATVNATASAAWMTSYFSEIITLTSSTTYGLGLVANGTLLINYDTGGTNQGFSDSSNSMASPTSPTDATRNNNVYSIFATYSTSANTYVIYPTYWGYFEERSTGSFGDSTKTFDDLHSATSAYYKSDQSSGLIVTARADHLSATSKWWAIQRVRFTVDTSILDGKTITDATANYTVNTLYANGTEDEGNIHIVPFTPASDTSFVSADYAEYTFTSEGSENREDHVADSATISNIPLNSSSISRINKTGLTHYGMITEADLNNSATWFDAGINSYNGIRPNPTATVPSRWPYFTYTFSAGGGGSPIASTGGVTWANLAKIAAIAKASIAKVAGVASS